MKITLLANRDIASNLALNYLLPRLVEEHSLTVYLSGQVGAAGAVPPELAQLRFFEQTLFNELLFPAIDRGTATGELLTFAGLSRFTATPPAILNRINSEPGLATLAASKPDLVLSIRYGGILREAAIAVAPLGVINLHSGLLPDYRGVMATFRALLNGETRIGTTVHTISDPGIDTGAIIATTGMPVQPGKSYLWHVLELYAEGCARLADCVAMLAAGGALPQQPQPAQGNYYSFPDTRELATFAAQGWTLYDADEVAALAQQYLGETI